MGDIGLHRPPGQLKVCGCVKVGLFYSDLIGDAKLGRGQRTPVFILGQGYSASGLTRALADVPDQLLVRIAGDRVFYDGAPKARSRSQRRARPPLRVVRRGQPAPPDQVHAVPETSRYGRVEVRAWHHMHQKVQPNGYFAGQYPTLNTSLPVIEGTVIEVRVDRLPDGRNPHRTLWQTQRWTWIVLSACAQLRPARHLVNDSRRPRERPPRPGQDAA
ncbi:hypothetical protein [Streptomyces sp. NPDC048527]|uniref:hypothetical protein n=1 Tax=Streptomyces sp. NPDC048527 TaxID=3365568 RepID=UPI00371A447A